MWKLIRAASCALIAILVSGCVYVSRHTISGACSDDLGSPIHNFCVVAPQMLWRGERPTRMDAQWLLEQHVGTVVSLQLDDRRAFEAVTLGQDFVHTVAYFHVAGFSPLHLLSPEHVDTHLALFVAIAKAAPKPIYVHCRAGVDRTGVLTAAYRVLVDGVSRDQAIAEMARYHSPWQSIDARYIRGLSQERRQQILRKAAAWEARLRPTAQIECVSGRCTYEPTVEPSSKEPGA
jgi:hypothetical protein